MDNNDVIDEDVGEDDIAEADETEEAEENQSEENKSDESEDEIDQAEELEIEQAIELENEQAEEDEIEQAEEDEIDEAKEYESDEAEKDESDEAEEYESDEAEKDEYDEAKEYESDEAEEYESDEAEEYESDEAEEYESDEAEKDEYDEAEEDGEIELAEEDESDEDEADEGDDEEDEGPQRTPGVFVIPKIQDVISIEYQIVPGTGDSTIGKMLENYISAIEQCPFHGLDSINYDEVNEDFSELIEMSEATNDDPDLLGKITRAANAFDFQIQAEHLNGINFEKLWYRFARMDELPQITWAQIDQNDALAVNEFCQAFERKIVRVRNGFQECVLRTISLSMCLAEVKHYVGLLGLWDSVKGHYDHDKVPDLEESESDNVIPSQLFPRLKTNLFEKSKILLDPVWTHGNRFQLLHNHQIGEVETIINSDLEWGLHALRHGVSFGDGTRTLGTLKSEQETAAFETWLLDLDEETKELVHSSIAKFTELENDVVELEKLRDQTILAVILLMDD